MGPFPIKKKLLIQHIFPDTVKGISCPKTLSLQLGILILAERDHLFPICLMFTRS